MSKTVSHVEDLPEWFDIRPYEQWEDKDPLEAVSAVRDRLYIAEALKGEGAHFTSELKDAALERLAETSSNPCKTNIQVLFDLLRGEMCLDEGVSHDEFMEYAEYEREVCKVTRLEAKRILKGGQVNDLKGICRVSLYDAVTWITNNQEIIAEAEIAAQRLSQEHGWDLEEVRKTLHEAIPIYGESGADFISIDAVPSAIPYAIKDIKKYFLSRSSYGTGVASARISDVRKLFEYRVAAYADLMAWSHLVGCKITKKCLANALFPDGRFGEIDMQPSKTVGGFIKRLEEGYIKDLVAKSVDMDTMQSW